jgi:hypothetical protein
LILVANCPAPLGTSDFLRLTLTKEWTFCEFATSIIILWVWAVLAEGGLRMQTAYDIAEARDRAGDIQIKRYMAKPRVDKS